MADKVKFTDNQVAALATFFGGVSELLKRHAAKGKDATIEDMRLTLDVINVGSVITAAQFQANLSTQEVYGAALDAEKFNKVEDAAINDAVADIVDLEAYRAKGGLLN